MPDETPPPATSGARRPSDVAEELLAASDAAGLTAWQREYLDRAGDRDTIQMKRRLPIDFGSGVVQGSRDGAPLRGAYIDELEPRHRALTVGDNSCLACGEHFNARQALRNGAVPEEGSLSICHRCGAVAIFTAKRGVLRLRRPSAAEALELQDHVEVKAARSALLVARAIADHPLGKKP